MKPSHTLLYCRPGFEKEGATEIAHQAGSLGAPGYVRTREGSGFVQFFPHDPEGIEVLSASLSFQDLVFARQVVLATDPLTNLPATDRLTPLLAAIQSLGHRFSACWLETADTNEAKELSSFCRKFGAHLEKALVKSGLLVPGNARLPRLHLFFLDSGTAHLGVSWADRGSPWHMGIPRLRLPRAAPSRSALKLGEAFLSLLSEAERNERLKGSMRAVDLGAAPGGWSWQLTQRSLLVTAVDNGPMNRELLAQGMVEHIRADGFRYRHRKPVDWMVCDMVEQPARIAALVADWVAEGRARDCIFNLKLPMKKRFDEIERCRDIVEHRLGRARLGYRLRMRHLYHDREEITGYLGREQF